MLVQLLAVRRGWTVQLLILVKSSVHVEFV